MKRPLALQPPMESSASSPAATPPAEASEAAAKDFRDAIEAADKDFRDAIEAEDVELINTLLSRGGPIA